MTIGYATTGISLNCCLSVGFILSLVTTLTMAKKANIPYVGQSFFADPFDSANPCVYPIPEFGTGCNLPQDWVKQYRICDATGNAFSYTEAHELTKHLDQFNQKHNIRVTGDLGTTCICDNSLDRDGCWYKFGYAFVQKLDFPKYDLPEGVDSRELCAPTNDTQLGETGVLPTPKLETFAWNDVRANKFGAQMAQLIRERWRIGKCGEDILVLVVKKRPQQVSNESLANDNYLSSSGLNLINFSWKGHRNPSLSTRYGDEVVRRLSSFDQSDIDAIPLEANRRLDSGYTLIEVLQNLLTSYESLLETADQMSFRPKTLHSIPAWALWAFGGCALLLLIIAMGLFLLKTDTRRSSSHQKTPAVDSSRRWKAGFVGGMFTRRSKPDEENNNNYRTNDPLPDNTRFTYMQ